MIDTNFLANFIESALNENSTSNMKFLVFSDVGDMRKAKRCCKYEYYTNCILETVSSSITPIKNMSFETITMQVMFAVDIAEIGRTEQGDLNRKQSRTVIDVKNAIGQFIEAYNGSTTSQSLYINGEQKNYAMTMSFGYPTDGQVSQIGHISEALPIYLSISFAFFENGMNANNVKMVVDGEDLYFTRCVISKVRTADQNEFAQTKGAKSYILMGGKSYDLVIPTLDTYVGKEIMKDIIGDEENVARCVHYEADFPSGTVEKYFIGIFGNDSVNIDAGANLGYNLSVVEAKENLLKYDDENWDIIVASQENVTITNIDVGQNDVVFWGDGTISSSTNGEATHTYIDGNEKHTIRHFLDIHHQRQAIEE